MNLTELDPLLGALPRAATRLEVVVLGAAARRAGSLLPQLATDTGRCTVTLPAESVAATAHWLREHVADAEDLLVAEAGPEVAATLCATVGSAWAAEAEVVADLAVASTVGSARALCAALRLGPLPVESTPLGMLLAPAVCSPQSLWLV